MPKIQGIKAGFRIWQYAMMKKPGFWRDRNETAVRQRQAGYFPGGKHGIAKVKIYRRCGLYQYRCLSLWDLWKI